MNEDINDDMQGNNSGTAEEIEEGINHEQESTDDERITIDDINIISQMNSSQMAIGEEEQERQPTHSSNLRDVLPSVSNKYRWQLCKLTK